MRWASGRWSSTTVPCASAFGRPALATSACVSTGHQHTLPLAAASDGWFELTTREAVPGTLYRYRIDDEISVPDPASRHNPQDVDGPSAVVDPFAFDWDDEDWLGRRWEDAVVYELHVGTFSREGTFAAIEAKLDHLCDLGVTALELMPIGDFSGTRGWGYDGVLPFAPDASYGDPAALKHLVVAAHRRGLMVFLDVVYNHFGPVGNYLSRYAPQFFTSRHRTPWGHAINFGRRGRPRRARLLHRQRAVLAR